MPANNIEVARYMRLFQKLLQAKGSLPSLDLSSDVTPVFPLEDVESAELRYLSSWYRYMRSQSPTGAVGFNSKIRLRNPKAAGVVLVVELCSCTGGANTDTPFLDLGTGDVDLATIPAGINDRLDARQQQTGPVAVISTDNTTAGVGPGTQLTALQGATQANAMLNWIGDVNQEIPILPGDWVQIRSGTTNQQIIGNFMWRERTLEESEKA